MSTSIPDPPRHDPATRHEIRLVATDLDGTLLRPDGTVSDRTRAALRRVQARGVPVVLVTARPPRVARRVAEMLDVRGPLICCNGALVVDGSHGEIVRHTPIDAAAAHAFVTAIRATHPEACFAAEIGLRFGRDPGWVALSRQGVQDTQPDESEDHLLDDVVVLCQRGVTKLLIRHPSHAVDALAASLRGLVGETAVITYSGGPFVEISAVGVHKAAALEALASDLGIEREQVLAFGDMPNDLPMLRWAGRGIAVANAHPDVLTTVAETTGANVDDGVAAALERLILTA